MSMLRSLPNAGRECTAPGFEGVRRLLLRRSSYHVYYSVDLAAARILVLAIRHSARRAPEARPE